MFCNLEDLKNHLENIILTNDTYGFDRLFEVAGKEIFNLRFINKKPVTIINSFDFMEKDLDYNILCYALQEGGLELLKHIINKYSQYLDLNQTDSNGRTLFFKAIAADQVEIINLLIEHGADKYLDKDGASPLMIAAAKGSIESIILFFKSGVDINEVDKSGRTALIYALSFNQIKCAKFLILAGADVNVSDKSGKTAIYAAIELGNRNLIEKILSKKVHKEILNNTYCYQADTMPCTFNNGIITNMRIGTALEMAILKGMDDVVELLLQAGADINKVIRSPYLKSYETVLEIIRVKLRSRKGFLLQMGLR